MFAPLVTGVRSCSTRLTSKRMSKRELHLVMMGVAFLTKEGVHNARDLPTVLFLLICVSFPVVPFPYTSPVRSLTS